MMKLTKISEQEIKEYMRKDVRNYIGSSIKYTIISMLLGANIVALSAGLFGDKTNIGIGCIVMCVLLLIGHFFTDFGMLLNKLYSEEELYLELNNFIDMLNKEDQ